MNFLKKAFFASEKSDELSTLPSGRLYLTRSPNSPKGARECLYSDACATIRQTNTPYYYTLMVSRMYQEGELDANGSEYDSDEEESDSDLGRGNGDSANRIANGHNDEWSFTISEDLQIYSFTNEDGTKAISWNDLNGDFGDRFEFVIDEEIKYSDIDSFLLSLYKCVYELKYNESSMGIEDLNQLQEFILSPKDLLNLDKLKKDMSDLDAVEKNSPKKPSKVFSDDDDYEDDEDYDDDEDDDEDD
ncbi:uncharacterized protein KQ657_002992 [Scheffersomyces spartinae]|uniref:Vid27 N-terminal domain-containing protein n=1 Tax=Scheffersomyces spartinae TaxID=45513 RepID=A0A9P7V5E5_9ASCO|nr:uncharacterized protein KQ657_002992 [Scheffersomyces spartinae]KAG7191597.1 hypothetical protein KQ657_002992 [Scheffersomyces spartinae]